MATFKINDMISMLEGKSGELLNKIEEMEKDLNLSENTVRTQRQVKSHEAHNLLIMVHLCRFLRDYYFQGNGEMELPGDVGKWFESTTMLTETRKKGTVVLHDGDSVFDIMEAHPSLTMAKVKELIAKQGFMLDKGIIRK